MLGYHSIGERLFTVAEMMILGITMNRRSLLPEDWKLYDGGYYPNFCELSDRYVDHTEECDNELPLHTAYDSTEYSIAGDYIRRSLYPTSRFVTSIYRNKSLPPRLEKDSYVGLYVTHGHNDFHPTGMDFYHRALALFPHRNILALVPNNVRIEPVEGQQIIHVSELYDWERITLLSRCSDFIIGANPDAWWGAYLSENRGKRVYYPTHFLADITQQPLLIPKKWTSI